MAKLFESLEGLTDKGFVPKLFPVMSWAAVVDGVSLKDIPIKVIQSGGFNKVPLIMGTNHDEGNLFTDIFVFGV